jgi:hypothetical protein
MFRKVALVVLSCALVASCERSKSDNPLSPSIAGPIAGVTINQPKPVDPASSSQIAVDQQPVTLTVQNATTTGVRPLTYTFEIATDPTFSAKIFSQTGIEPGAGGQTKFKLPQSLLPDRNYYWRTKADDGANASDFSAAAMFRVYTPVIIQPPVLKLPTDNATVDTRRPALVVTNATRTGPAGAIQYLFELATDGAMANKVFAVLVNEASTQTSYTGPSDLAYATRYFWRVKAVDPTHQSDYTSIWSFVTPAAPPPPPTPTPTPTPTPGPSPAPVANDAINMAAAQIHNSPFNLASWPATTAITRLELRPTGVHIEFSKQNGADRWPDVVPPGFSGPLQYTLGMCLNIGGQWHCSAVVEFWHGLDEAGGEPQNYAINWFYDPSRWGPMSGHQPAPGETIGFFACAGDCRNNTSGSSSPVKERTNVVLVPMPGPGGASFSF